MDSSRSGLLSTILMTLPLIVVPAVALLRPPGQAGVSTVDLEASEDESELDDSFFDDFDALMQILPEPLRRTVPEIPRRATIIGIKKTMQTPPKQRRKMTSLRI